MIYLLRHGLDDENYIGGYSDVGLLIEGKEQVKIAAEYLKNNIEVEKIVSSDVRRAKETTEIVNETLGLPVEYSSILRELDKGILNGMLKTEAKIKYPQYMDVKSVEIKYPNGESMKEFYERIRSNLDEILKLDNSLLVTHRGVINMLYYILNDLPVDMDKEKFGVTHASIHELNPKVKKIRKVEYKWER